MTTIERAPAKINLFLEITGKRSDGYHEIDTIMQSVELCDIVGVEWQPDRENKMIMGCTDKNVPLDARNTANRAATLYMEAAGLFGRVTVAIEKRIPLGAGLGGGSADAAATLRALNKLNQNQLDITSLLAIAAKVGADVPFCLIGGAARAMGIGEILRAVPPLPECYIVIAMRGEGVPTKWAYEQFDAMEANEIRTADTLIAALNTGNREAVMSSLFNAFEPAILPHRPKTDALLTLMRENGNAIMTGSGAAVFGLYQTLSDARRAASRIRRRFPFAFVELTRAI